MQRIYKIIRSRLEYLVIIVLTTVLVGVIITLASPKEYEATARILVVQKQQNVDAFSASKSADYIAGVLREALYSNAFLDSLIKADSSVAKQLQSDRAKRIKEWSARVDASVLSNKGILSIKVFDSNPDIALRDANLIISTMISEGASYYGGSSAIDLRVIDSPSVSSKPTRPSLALNVLASLLVGLALDIVYIFFMDVRLSRTLEEREILGRIQGENTTPAHSDMIRGESRVGQLAHTETPLQPDRVQKNSIQENIPITEEPEKQIQNWMKKH